MGDQPARLPSGNGLAGSGYVVAVVRSADRMHMKVISDERVIGINVPGNPLRILLWFTRLGAEAMIAKLNEGLVQLQRESAAASESRSGTSGGG